MRLTCVSSQMSIETFTAVPDVLKPTVLDMLQLGTTEVRFTLNKFYHKDTSWATKDFLAALREHARYDQFLSFEKYYPTNLPCYNLFYRIVNHIKVNYTSTTPYMDMIDRVHEKFGGFVWNSGGNIMLLTILTGETSMIVVSEDCVCYYNEPTADSGDFMYLEGGYDAVLYEEI